MNDKFEHGAQRRIFTQVRTPSRDIAEAAKEIINLRYRGLANADIEPELRGYVKISGDRLAHLLKLLLKCADQNCFLKIFFRESEMRFCISVVKPENMIIKKEDAYELMRYSKQAGFMIIINEDEIALDTPLNVNESEFFAIYARTRQDIRKIFEKVFSGDI